MERDSVLPVPEAGIRQFHPVLRDLYARRLGSDEEAEKFLAAAGSLGPLPCDLVGAEELLDEVEDALDRDELIAVFGHDDPDGITSAAIAVETLERLGGRVTSYIPNRAVEGHGLYPDLIRSFARQGVRLILTTDGCSTNREEEELARELGMRVAVTDHHEVAEGRAAVTLLVNPKVRPGETDCTDLTGAGVAAVLMRGLLRRRAHDVLDDAADRDAAPTEMDRMAAAEKHFCQLLDLVALGTIADYGDLSRNNRGLVVRGLSAVAAGSRPAVDLVRRALEIGPAAVLRTNKAQRLAAVFAAVPSVNGRSPGLDALLTRESWAGDVQDCVHAFLDQEARIREGISRIEAAAARELEEGTSAVVRVDDVAQRSLGKGATRLVERTGRPAAAILPLGDRIVGELRGPDGVNLVDVLAGLADRLESWGGHRQAAGFSAPIDQADDLICRLREELLAMDVPDDASAEDAVPIRRSDVDQLFSRTLRAAMPFGKGNRSPRFRILDYREGGTSRELDQRDRVNALLSEGEFPDRPAGHDPIVTFVPRGAGGLKVHFEGWVPTLEGPA